MASRDERKGEALSLSLYWHWRWRTRAMSQGTREACRSWEQCSAESQQEKVDLRPTTARNRELFSTIQIRRKWILPWSLQKEMQPWPHHLVQWGPSDSWPGKLYSNTLYCLKLLFMINLLQQQWKSNKMFCFIQNLHNRASVCLLCGHALKAAGCLVFPFSSTKLNRHLLPTTSHTCHTAFHPRIGYNSPLSCWHGYDSFHTSLFIKIICTSVLVPSHFKVQLLTNLWSINFSGWRTVENYTCFSPL